MIYKASDRSAPTAVTSDWFAVPVDENWHRVAVRTTYPLPDTLEWLQVYMVGRTYAEGFSVYIDEAAFSIVTDAVAPSEWSYSDPCYRDPGERGIFTANLQTYFAKLNGGTYNVKTNVVLNAEALEGYVIRNIDIFWNVDGSDAAHMPNSASLPMWTNPNSGLQEGYFFDEHSGDWVHPPDQDVTTWNSECSYWTDPAVKVGVAYGVGLLTFLAGIPYPISTTISSMVGAGISYRCQPIYLGSSAYTATVGYHGLASVFYPTESSVDFTRLCLNLDWQIGEDQDLQKPVTLRVDFRVSYSGIYDYRVDVVQTQSLILVLQV